MEKRFLVLRITRALDGLGEPSITFDRTFEKFENAYKRMEELWNGEIATFGGPNDHYISFSQGNTMRGLQYPGRAAGGVVVDMWIIKSI